MYNRSCLARVDVERGEGCPRYCQIVCRCCLQRVKTLRARRMLKSKTKQCIVWMPQDVAITV